MLITGLAHAQDASPPLPAPRPLTAIPSRPLLMEPAVQREIGLSEKQKTNLALLDEEINESRQAAVAEPGEEGFDFNNMMAGMEDLAKQQRAATAKLLTPAQKNRLLQIEWQREGWLALGRADVAGKLGLKAPQLQKIRATIVAMREDQSKVVFAVPDAVAKARQTPAKSKPALNPANGFQGDPETVIPGGGPLNFTAEQFQAQTTKTVEESARVAKQAAKEVDAMLTPEQKTAFTRLLGPPFDFNLIDTASPAGGPRPGATKKRSGATKGATKSM